MKMQSDTCKSAADKAGNSQYKQGDLIPLSLVERIEKRMGARVWDGVFYNRDSITNPMLSILPNKVGQEICNLLNQVGEAEI